MRRRARLAVGRLGPGLITGAADDDPSGIATYSQAGAQFGPNMLWTVVFTYPLMLAVQSICARVGRVTGNGLASNLLGVFPRWVVMGLVALLFVANTINIGADVAAMGAAAQLLIGSGQTWFTIAAAIVSLLLQIFVPYHRYVHFLKWLTLVLFAYVAVVFTVDIDWGHVLRHVVLPDAPITAGWVTVVVAVFGTTISPYLFFWQTSEEVEEMEANHQSDLLHAPPSAARHQLRRILTDTSVGMGLSNLIAFFIILTAATTLHAKGITNIQTSAQAAEALRPIAGPLAFLLFSLGIIGTGLLAVPVLAGSTAYAAAELFGWKEGLEQDASKAKGFYAVIALSMVCAIAVVFSPLDPIKALFWSAVVNGTLAVPILGATMMLATRRDEMGVFVATAPQRIFGWAATIVMAGAAVAMFVL
ncbi:MAG TPA: divalent metal cation transporter [Sphingomicrobium sp.]|jgi:NRAMP (natural resistance-associated macrophage protein)-like metal ion transporter|nr:divalent metal cation transporter [Sphingomicrobium sp.]